MIRGGGGGGGGRGILVTIAFSEEHLCAVVLISSTFVKHTHYVFVFFLSLEK